MMTGTSCPNGFKHTEMGDIPVEWEITKLGALSSLVTSGSRGWAQFYAEYGALFVRITNLQRNCVSLDLSDCKFVNLPANNSEAKRTELQADDVLLSITADLGTIGLVPPDLGKAYINQHIALIRLCVESSAPGFVANLLASRWGQDQFLLLNDGGSKAGLNLANIRAVAIPLPPTKAEQEAIAEVLSDADALIEALEQLIAKKRHIKQGAMQELLTGKKRLPGFETKPGAKQTELGVIPEDWDAVPIGKLFEFKNGLNKAKQFFGSGTPIVNYMDVLCHSGLRREDVAGRVTVSSEERRNYSAKAGDVFFTRTSETVEEIGTVAVLLEDIEGAVFSGFVLRGRPIAEYLQLQFKKYCFSHEIVRKQIITNCSYTTRALTNGRLLSKVFILLPPTKAEQEAIAAILSDMDTEIAALEAKLAKARQIKQGMMHNLLTGRIRLV